MATKTIPNLADCPQAVLADKTIKFILELGYEDLFRAWYEKSEGDHEFILHKAVQLLLDLGHQPLVNKWLEEAKISIDLKNGGYVISNVTPLVQKGGAE